MRSCPPTSCQKSHKSEINFTNNDTGTAADDYEDEDEDLEDLEDSPVGECEDVLLSTRSDSLVLRGSKGRNSLANKGGKENFKPGVSFQSDCGTRKTWI